MPLTVAQLPSHARVTFQNVLPDFLMAPSTPIPPQQVATVHDPLPFAAVEGLVFTRPDYLKVGSLVLVVLITVSGVLALITRSINELVLGVGDLPVVDGRRRLTPGGVFFRLVREQTTPAERRRIWPWSKKAKPRRSPNDAAPAS